MKHRRGTHLVLGLDSQFSKDGVLVVEALGGGHDGEREREGERGKRGLENGVLVLKWRWVGVALKGRQHRN